MLCLFVVQVCQDVISEVPLDDHVLATLTVVLKSEDKLHLATQMFENACEREPQNEELALGLFTCYIRWVTAATTCAGIFTAHPRDGDAHYSNIAFGAQLCVHIFV